MAPRRTSVTGAGNTDADRVRVVVRIRPPVRKDEKFGEGSEALQYDVRDQYQCSGRRMLHYACFTPCSPRG
jgi:hypothetical protein